MELQDLKEPQVLLGLKVQLEQQGLRDQLVPRARRAPLESQDHRVRQAPRVRQDLKVAQELQVLTV